MKLMVEIPKEIVKAIQNGQDYRYDIHTAIAQGISVSTDGDSISREALKKAIKSYADDQYAENEYLGECAIMTIIDDAPTVAPVSNDKWIPIKTRKLTEEEKEEYPDWNYIYDCKLPDDGEEVLVTTFSGMVTLDTFYRDDGCYFECYCDDGDVIAWQPKPESYNE